MRRGGAGSPSQVTWGRASGRASKMMSSTPMGAVVLSSTSPAEKRRARRWAGRAHTASRGTLGPPGAPAVECGTPPALTVCNLQAVEHLPNGLVLQPPATARARRAVGGTALATPYAPTPAVSWARSLPQRRLSAVPPRRAARPHLLGDGADAVCQLADLGGLEHQALQQRVGHLALHTPQAPARTRAGAPVADLEPASHRAHMRAAGICVLCLLMDGAPCSSPWRRPRPLRSLPESPPGAPAARPPRAPAWPPARPKAAPAAAGWRRARAAPWRGNRPPWRRWRRPPPPPPVPRPRRTACPPPHLRATHHARKGSAGLSSP